MVGYRRQRDSMHFCRVCIVPCHTCIRGEAIKKPPWWGGVKKSYRQPQHSPQQCFVKTLCRHQPTLGKTEGPDLQGNEGSERVSTPRLLLFHVQAEGMLSASWRKGSTARKDIDHRSARRSVIFSMCKVKQL